MKKQMKKTMWSIRGLVLLGFIINSVSFISPTPVSAEKKLSDTHISKSITDPLMTFVNSSSQTRVLDPIENGEGLSATPKVLILAKDKVFPDITTEKGLKTLFSKRIIPFPGEGAVYEYVNEDGSPATPSSEQVGFQTIYVEITENHSSSSIRVPIPVTITDVGTSLLLDKRAALQVENSKGKIILYPNETVGKTTEQLQQLVKNKSNVQAWNTEDGTSLPVNVTKTTILTTSVGVYTAEFEVTLNSGGREEKSSIQREVLVFGADPKSFVAVAQNGNLPLGSVPSNLFTKFQIVNGTIYKFVDENGEELEKFDTGTVGFHWASVKMTDKKDEHITTTIKVAINVTSADTTLLLTDKVMVKSSEKHAFYPDETKGKTPEELLELVQSKSDLSAWNTRTGEAVPASFTKTTIKNNSLGSYIGTIKVELDGKSATTTRQLIVFGAELKSPYYFLVDQNKRMDMGTNAANFFRKYQTLLGDGGGADYEWVKNSAGEPTEPVNQFDTSQRGFHWGYIKMTDRTNATVSTIIPVPIMVTADPSTVIVGSKVGVVFKAVPIINESDIKEKTTAQILDVLNEKLAPIAWELVSGQELDVQIINSTIDNSHPGNYKATIEITLGEKQLTHTFIGLFLPDQTFGDMFGDNSLNDWKTIPLDSSEGTLINPINGSKMGFPKRGIYALDNDLGFVIKDKANEGYIYGDKEVLNIPAVNHNPLYAGFWGWGGESAVTYTDRYKGKYFLRRGNDLMQILMDEKNEIMFVYNLSMNRNLNFNIKLDMYNLSSKSKSFSMFENVDTDYYKDSVPIYALGNNSGFYIQPNKGKRFTIRLKNAQGNWLSEYSRYIVTSFPKIFKNNFGDDFKTPGSESENYKAGKVIIQGEDSAYQLGAPWKSVAPGKALKTGYEIFAGDELPYMQIKAEPESFDIYPDYTEDFESDYTLSEIPTVNDHGTVYITYPSGKEIRTPFNSNSQKEFKDHLRIPRAELPQKLNDKPGTIKRYDTSMLAINEADGPMKELPSEDYAVKVNVYHLGATAIAQTIQKDKTWNKEADSLIKGQIILPGHTASFEYVNASKPVDTSKVGLQYAEVRMTDTDEPTQTTIIKVPVLVTKEEPPTSGLMLTANDFTIQVSEVSDLSDTAIEQLILDKSNSFAWDIGTGLSDEVNVSVTQTTLTNLPIEGETYSATIKAKKGEEIKTKTIEIKVDSAIESSLKVHFVDEKGNPLHEPYEEKYERNTEVDLTKKKEITTILDKLKKQQYDLVKRPEKEVITILEGENELTYQFNGTLKILSAPAIFDFETKTATQNAAKYTDPKIIGEPLVVSDTRADKLKWVLKAKVEQPLTSLEDEQAKLPDSIKYKYEDDELALTEEDSIIFSHLNTDSGSYDVTEERWSKGEGFLLDLPSGSIKALGKYQAKITITLENAK